MKKEIFKKHDKKNRINLGAVYCFNAKGEKVYYSIKEFDLKKNKYVTLGNYVTVNELK